MRILPLTLAVAFIAIFASAVSAAAGQPAAGRAHFVVQVDPRLCPSPMCGGYWVRQANRAQTRCSDGKLQPRCYVWRALDERRRPHPAGLREGALVLGRLEPDTTSGFGELGQLIVAEAREPAGRNDDRLLYRVRDTGIRCVRAPCFFMRAWRLSTSYTVTVSELDLGAAGLTSEQQRRAETAVESKTGLFLAGRVERASDGGRRLAAVRVYLKGSPPRA